MIPTAESNCRYNEVPMLINKKKRLIPILIGIAALATAFFAYTADYYHADSEAEAALASDAAVQISRTSFGWLFDGPSEENALIFYPGAKVEETAYAPLLHRLAEEGMDVCLVKMPFHLAFFGLNEATDVMERYAYRNWYIGGHSLGGAMAAEYAASHGDRLDGLILLAAYPTKALDSSLLEISIYGSEDTVLNMEKVVSGRSYAPANYAEFEIEGGNHAQFGSYGMQKGDGTAAITEDEQQCRTTELIIGEISKAVPGSE